MRTPFLTVPPSDPPRDSTPMGWHREVRLLGKAGQGEDKCSYGGLPELSAPLPCDTTGNSSRVSSEQTTLTLGCLTCSPQSHKKHISAIYSLQCFVIVPLREKGNYYSTFTIGNWSSAILPMVLWVMVSLAYRGSITDLGWTQTHQKQTHSLLHLFPFPQD